MHSAQNLAWMEGMFKQLLNTFTQPDHLQHPRIQAELVIMVDSMGKH